MNPTLRDLLEAPERVTSTQPDALASVLGELVILLARLMVQANSKALNTQPATNQDGPESLLTVREAAAVLNLQPRYIYELVRRRELPAIRVGKYVRVRRTDLHDWLERHREEGVDAKIHRGLGSTPTMSERGARPRGRTSR